MPLLVAYTQTPEGHAALAYGLELAQKDSTGSMVVFALDQPSGQDDSAIAAQPVPEGLDTSGVELTWLGPDTHGSDPTEDLLEMATALRVEKIVVGVRRRSRVGKFILGSMAQKIIIGADVPVVSVKASGEE